MGAKGQGSWISWQQVYSTVDSHTIEVSTCINLNMTLLPCILLTHRSKNLGPIISSYILFYTVIPGITVGWTQRGLGPTGSDPELDRGWRRSD